MGSHVCWSLYSVTPGPGGDLCLARHAEWTYRHLILPDPSVERPLPEDPAVSLASGESHQGWNETLEGQ